MGEAVEVVEQPQATPFDEPEAPAPDQSAGGPQVDQPLVESLRERIRELEEENGILNEIKNMEPQGGKAKTSDPDSKKNTLGNTYNDLLMSNNNHIAAESMLKERLMIEESKNQELSKKINTLNTTVVTQKTRMAKVTKMCKDYIQQLKGLKKEGKELSARITSLESDVKNRDGVISDKETTIEGLEESIAHLNSLIADMEQEKSALVLSLESLRDSHSKLCEEHEDLTQLNAENEEKVTKLTSSLEDTQAMLDETITQGDALKLEKEDLTSKLAAANEREAALIEKVKKLEEDLEEVKEEKDIHSKGRVRVEKENAKLYQKVEALGTKISLLKEDVAQKGQRIDELEEKTKDHEKLQEDLGNCNDLIQKMKSIGEGYKRKITLMRGQVVELQKRADFLQEQKDNIQKQFDDLVEIQNSELDMEIDEFEALE